MPTCKECNQSFKSRQYNADFCGSPCRKVFNNRRATRGAMLYDLLMIQATDTATFERVNLEGRAAELIERWKAEDKRAQRTRTTKRPYDVQMDTAALLR